MPTWTLSQPAMWIRLLLVFQCSTNCTVRQLDVYLGLPIAFSHQPLYSDIINTRPHCWTPYIIGALLEIKPRRRFQLKALSRPPSNHHNVLTLSQVQSHPTIHLLLLQSHNKFLLSHTFQSCQNGCLLSLKSNFNYCFTHSPALLLSHSPW